VYLPLRLTHPINYVDCSSRFATDPRNQTLQTVSEFLKFPVSKPGNPSDSPLKNKVSLYYKMSGGIAQLVAVGAQDVHLVGDPQVSFFRSTYKRHTNFSQTVERQVIQGNVSNNGMSTIRFERKGDLLNYVYLMPIAGDGLSANTFTDNWTDVISKVELLIGGQVIDEQDSTYSTLIAPTLSAFSSAKSTSASLYDGTSASKFYPLRFSFCENWQSALPLISLQYHDVELRITLGCRGCLEQVGGVRELCLPRHPRA